MVVTIFSDIDISFIKTVRFQIFIIIREDTPENLAYFSIKSIVTRYKKNLRAQGSSYKARHC